MTRNLRRELLTKWLTKNPSGLPNIQRAGLFLKDYPDIDISINRVSKDIAEIEDTVGKRDFKRVKENAEKFIQYPKAATPPREVLSLKQQLNLAYPDNVSMFINEGTILKDGKIQYPTYDNVSSTTVEQVLTPGWVTSTTLDPRNTLIIGDLHEPFTVKGAVDFCLEQQKKFNCGTVVFNGDIVDSHSISYHEKDPDGMSQKDEHDLSLQKLSEWYRAFPEARVTLGNHDLLIYRKMQSAGLSTRYLKDWNSIFNAPKGWKFEYDFIENNVRFTHGGSGGDALKMAINSRISTVQGHLHSQCYVQYSVSMKDAIFGMQVGCMIDYKSYAFNYSKPFPKKPVIACGVILDEGRVPFNVLMDL